MSQDEGDKKFIKLGRSGNLLRTSGSPSPVEITPVLSIKSNLFSGATLARAGHEKGEGQTISLQTMKPVAAGIKIWTEAEFSVAVDCFRDFVTDEERIFTEEEGQVVFALIERQSRSDSSVFGFFEMLREVDENRGRQFRNRLLKALQSLLPDRSVAKILGEAFIREQKDSGKSKGGGFASNAAKKPKLGKGKSLDECVDFNRSFPRWLSFFRSLKRKPAGLSVSRLNDLYAKKDSFVLNSFLYLFYLTEAVEKEFRQQIGSVYGQFRTAQRSIFESFRGEENQDRCRCLVFLKQAYVALAINEVLEHYVNILKLEGPAASSLCPDKKSFIMQHLRRIYNEALESSGGQVDNLACSLGVEWDPSQLLECIYNRKDVFVKISANINDKDHFFTFYGTVDDIGSIKCSLELGV